MINNNMNGKILVTDTLFVFDEHVKKMEDAGYEIVRFEKPDMNEDELSEAIKGKVGYILGGIECVTDKVFENADQLKALIFTGTGYKGHVPGWQKAKDKGIKIATTPFANVYEVAEWALSATLAMQRDLFDLGPDGKTTFYTVDSIPDLDIGVFGFGHIGEKYSDFMSALSPKSISYWNRSDKNNQYTLKSKEDLFKDSDIIFVPISEEVENDFINKDLISLMKPNALLVSICRDGIINEVDLAEALNAGKIRAAFDKVGNHDLFKGLSNRVWYASTAAEAYNSRGYLKRSSDMAVESLLNLLSTGEDQYRVV